MLAPVRTVAPVGTVIALSDAKRHLRVDYDDEDAMIGALISAAVDYLDGYSGILGRALLTQTWRQDFDAFDDEMRLPVGNLLSVSSVTYYDASNALQTLSNAVYTGLSDRLGPYLTRKPDQVWPSGYYRPDAISVTWTAGYGATAASIPTPIKQAILLLVGHWYANREAVNVAAGIVGLELPMAVDALIAPYRRVST